MKPQRSDTEVRPEDLVGWEALWIPGCYSKGSRRQMMDGSLTLRGCEGFLALLRAVNMKVMVNEWSLGTFQLHS